MKAAKKLSEKYKMTELGLLPEEWSIRKLDDEIFSFQSGLWKGKKGLLTKVNVLRNTNFNNDGTLSYVDVAELDVQVNQFEGRKLENGDILLERSGGGPTQPVGRVVIFIKNDANFSFSNFTTRIRVLNTKICDSNYLLFFLLYLYQTGYTEKLQNRTTGIRNLNFTDYKKTLIPLPLLSEQKRIVSVLSAVHEAKEKAENAIEATKELKKSLMKHLFTYGPVSVNDIEKVQLKETEIGKIPEHWRVVKFENAIERTQYGLSVRGNSKGLYPILRMNNLIDGYMDISNLQYVDLNEKSFKDYRLNKNDILFNRTNSFELVGKTSLFSLKGDYVFASYLVRAVPDTSKSVPGYLNYYLNWKETQKRLKMLASRGVSQSNINATKLRGLSIPLPPLSEQQQIAQILSAIDEKILSEEKKKKTLDEFFKSLLLNLMTGKVRVKGLEAIA